MTLPVAAPLAIVLALLAAAPRTAGGEDRAATILRATGVKGGLVVHVGCGDAALTAALHRSDAYLVEGLETDPAVVDAARARLARAGLYGQVSVVHWAGKRLPYVDNLVNLVVCERPGAVPRREIERVLAPGGVAWLGPADGKAEILRKPWPKEMDEWTHFFHSCDGNPVSNDRLVGPPRRLRWVGSPRWARHHDHMASMSALVSAGGRLFYIMDEGPRASIQLPPRWMVVARDAFSGVVLWKRHIPEWHTHLWPLKSGPALLTRRLVTDGQRVYTTLSIEAPLVALDPATGKTLRTYQQTKPALEVVLRRGVLLVVSGRWPAKVKPYHQIYSYCWDETARANRGWAWSGEERRLLALEAPTGKVIWQARSPISPLTTATDGKRVYFHDGRKVVALDFASGHRLWASEPIPSRNPIPTSYGARLLVHDGVVVFAGGDRKMTALDAASGKRLWQAPHPRSGHMSPEDLMAIDGLVWSGAIAGGGDPGIFTGIDIHSGKVISRFPPDVKTYWFHHRCHPARATVRYILTSRTGIEFIDPKTKHWEPHHWVRGGCIYGIMPANGLVYAPPHSCGCYLESKLFGFNALAPGPLPPQVSQPPKQGRLQRGPAYSSLATRHSPPDPRHSTLATREDWPTYRHDPARSGQASSLVSAVALQPIWTTTLGRNLTAPVVCGGRVFVAETDAHTLHALDATSGKRLWRFIAGGRIDSPPTIYRGRVLFGCADGWVYCLRASDGELAWRFRAAPLESRLVAWEQVESPWPVHGSVLVHDGTLYCLAGRSMFLDGGIRWLKLDPLSGRLLAERVFDHRDPETGKNLQVKVRGLTMPVALSDILSTDGRYLYLRSQRITLDGKRQELAPKDVRQQVGDDVHLFATTGFLDSSWFHRSYWMFGRATAWGWGGWFRASQLVPAGRLLVTDGKTVFGYGRRPQYRCQSSVLEYHLFAARGKAAPERIHQVTSSQRRINAGRKNYSAADWRMRSRFPIEMLTAEDYRWVNANPPLLARAMVLSGDVLFVAGPPDLVDEKLAFKKPTDPRIQALLREQDEALAGRRGGLLIALSALDGEELLEIPLDAPPTWDGMAAARGRLYMSALDGSVICLAGK